jgi:glycosyltransferase involved in cell wall biosynthesis
VIFDHHDLNPELYEVKFGGRGLVHRALLWAERATFAIADVVICTNESYQKIAHDRGGKSAADTFIVRSGPDLAHFGRRPPVPELRARARFVVGYVGIIAEQDGVEYLVRAAHEVVHSLHHDDAHFVVVGTGPSLPGLRELASSMGLERYITFTGYLGGEQLLRTLSTFDIGIVPDPKNPYNDRCTMNKVLEYMAMGIPIVQFDLSEGRTSAGASAVYVRENDARGLARAIVTLLEDDALRFRMGLAGRQRLEAHYSWQMQIPHLLAAYRNALE